jgi:hypothetical protein
MLILVGKDLILGIIHMHMYDCIQVNVHTNVVCIWKLLVDIVISTYVVYRVLTGERPYSCDMCTCFLDGMTVICLCIQRVARTYVTAVRKHTGDTLL